MKIYNDSGKFISMKFEGSIHKSGKFWVVEIPPLDLTTQGRSKAEAYMMAGSVVEDIVGQNGFEVRVQKRPDDRFWLESNDTVKMIALMLVRQRTKHGLTLMEVAKRLGSTSPNAYGAYEQGRREPTLSQLEKLMKAVNPDGAILMQVA